MTGKTLRRATVAALALILPTTSLGSPPRVPAPGKISDRVAMKTGLIGPLLVKVRGAADRSQSQNNMKQIVLAMHIFHDATGRMPADITDKDGKAILSWRVAILPYIEQQALYDQFKLDEPWDSPANKKASQALVKVFISPHNKEPKDKDDYALTNYLGVAGKGTAFEAGAKLKIPSFTDGTSNTIVLVESATPVPWAKPADFEFDADKAVPNFAFPGQSTYGVALGDGSVHTVNPDRADEKGLKAMMTRAGGEAVNTDEVLNR